ncbi:MAG: tetratricopeptide repeat protein [Rhizomicrobium sp.]
MRRRNRGAYQDAEATLARCIALSPEEIAPRYHRANVLMELGRPEDAFSEAQALLARDPAHPLFLRLKATALEGMEDYRAGE